MNIKNGFGTLFRQILLSKILFSIIFTMGELAVRMLDYSKTLIELR